VPLHVAIEKGHRRVFARAVDWPGFVRTARDEAAALETLIEYAPRYKQVAGRSFPAPKTTAALRVVERNKGDTTTDFGVPAIETKADRRALDADELRRLVRLLEASWSAFDAAAKKAAGKTLTTGPRGGGRSVEKMRAHVLEAERAYLAKLGGSAPKGASMQAARAAITSLLAERARGFEPELSPRRKSPLWTPQYTIARSAWHALDHAWEIEDRVIG
jgi:hypothetical protein